MQKVIAVPIPSAEKLHLLARGLGPWVSVSERRVEAEGNDAESQEHNSTGGTNPLAGLETESGNAGGNKVVGLAEGEDGEVESWKVVVQEQLTLHQEEWKVVERPSQNKGTNLVVETLEWHAVEVLITTLPSQESNALENGEDSDGDGRGPPDNWVADEVNLAVVLAPEVDPAAKNWPGLWAGIPGMGVEKTGVGGPHDLLQLPELAEETWVLVVDLLSIWANGWVLVLLNIPDRVWQSSLLGAGHLLLLGSPLWQLNLVGEKSTPGHDMDESEFGLNGADSLLGEVTFRLGLNNLDTEEVVGISVKPSITVSRDLVLPLGLSHWRANIVRVKTSLGCNVPEFYGIAVLDECRWRDIVPSEGTVDSISCGIKWLSGILEEKDVVLILVWVKSDLLLLGARWVHKWMRVQVATLSVVMSDADAGAECNVGWSVAHALGVQGGLELGAHESITLSWVGEAEEVNGKHSHVESNWDDDQAEHSGENVLGHQSWGDVLVVSEEDPKLDNGQGANPCDSEESNPLHADGCAQSESRHDEPEPPVWLEGLGWALLMLVCEGGKGQRGEAGADHERRIEKNEAGLSKESVLCHRLALFSELWTGVGTKDNQQSSHGCDHSAASSGLEGQEHCWHQKDTADSWQSSHPDVWYIWLKVIFSDLLEVKVSVEATEPSSKGDEELSKWWVNVHEESALDVFRCEATKAEECTLA